ncbi:MAG: EI24 domain-containing protein [Bacteriovoracaceae bacterium]
MNKIFKCLPLALSVYKKDKWVFLLSLIPIALGILVFGLIGTYLYSDLLAWGQAEIQKLVENQALGKVVYYLLISVLTVAFYFLISFLFVMIVSLFASPFNDVISSRVERVILGGENLSLSQSFKGFFSKLCYTLVNEVKKISLILLLTLFSVVISLFPVFSIVSIILTSLLLAISFLDYAWSRKDLHFRECLGDMKKHFLPYGISGAGFLFFITVPVVNVFVYAFGVNYFTVLFVELHKENNNLKSEIVEADEESTSPS